MNEITEIVGWLGFALNLWGNLALTRYDAWGWIIRLGSNVAWVAYSANAGVWPLLANHITFAGVNVLGWIRWRRQR